MKGAVTSYVLFGIVCVIVLFVSMTVAADEVTLAIAKAKPMDGKIEAELARGRCVKGCCSRNFIGRCKVCCASAEEAAAAMVRGGFRAVHGGHETVHGGHGAAGEAQVKEAKP